MTFERRANRVELAPGIAYFPAYLDKSHQCDLMIAVRSALHQAPLFHPVMPKSGQKFSIRMSNCGPLGWVSDINGYRYQSRHPVTGDMWPPIPELLLAVWRELSGFAQPPQACLINFYGPNARMGLHQDRDEGDCTAPVISLSLGQSALFRYGGLLRQAPTHSITLASGDVLSFGGPARLMYHGIDRLKASQYWPLTEPGRINLTLRYVAPLSVSA